MSDTWMGGMLAGMGSGLLAPAGTPSSYSAQQMRQKIALAMLLKKHAAPKTFGEGLYSIGSSFGDALMAGNLERQAAEAAAKDTAIMSGYTPPSAAAAAAAAPAPAPASSATTGPRSDATEGDGTAATVAGFRPPPAYLAPHLAASGLSPERQAYLGHLAGKEAQSANEVSPTGAAGPFQFIRSTGRQYGLVGPEGDRRTDPVASIAAVNRFTDDNAAVLEKALGRPPSPSELALAHQQGAGTAAKMLSGSGNAPSYNLAVNNAGGLGPQAAAQKIMGYYGMPGSGGPRDNAAAILATRTADTPLTPADTAQEQRLGEVTGMTRAPPSFGPTASNRTGDVQSDMPPVTGALQGPLGASVGDTVQQRQQATQPPPQAAPPPPGPQLAQAGPFPPPPGPDAGGRIPAIMPGGGLPPAPPTAAPIPAAPPDPRAAIRAAPEEYVPRNRPMPEPPTKPPMGPVEQDMRKRFLNADVSDRVKAWAASQVEAERTQLGAVYENQLKNYEIRKSDWLKEQELETKYKMDRPKQAADVDQSRATTDKTRAETPEATAKSEIAQINAGFYKKTGRDREGFIKDFTAEKEQTAKAASLLRDVGIASEALASGSVASGFGADAKINAARIAAKIGSTDAKKIAEESEKYQKAMDRTLAYGVMLVNGKDPRVTEGDVAMAKGQQGTPDMQEASKRKIIQVMQEDLHGKINNYEDLREQYLRGDPQHRFFKVDAPAVGTPEVRKALIDHQERPDVIAEFDRMHGPGAAKLEIARHKRRVSRPDD